MPTLHCNLRSPNESVVTSTNCCVVPLLGAVGVLLGFLSPRLARANGEDASESAGWMQAIDRATGHVNEVLAAIIFYQIPLFGSAQVPRAVALLPTAGINFTLWMRLPPLSAFRHARALILRIANERSV